MIGQGRGRDAVELIVICKSAHEHCEVLRVDASRSKARTLQNVRVQYEPVQLVTFRVPLVQQSG